MSAKDTKNITAASEPAVDWAAVDALTDEEIKADIARNPDVAPILDKEWFANAELVLPGRKQLISIRLDEEVLAYFKEHGRGYQSRINAVLLNYVRARHPWTTLKGMIFRRYAARELTQSVRVTERVEPGDVKRGIPRREGRTSGGAATR